MLVVWIAAAIGLLGQQFSAADAAEPIETVACPSDGQMGPTPPPEHLTHIPKVPASVARDLAYYESAQLGVLAPKNWHCFGLYGSNGAQIIVTPEPHDASDLLKPGALLTGPAVQLALSYGDTSGRFEVAKTAARLFPAVRSYVEWIADEGTSSRDEFPAGPVVTDHLIRRSATDVEFETPAHTVGVGTDGRLAANADPISGAALLFPNHDMDLVTVRVRVPLDLEPLSPVIVREVEDRRDALLAIQ